MLTYRPCLELQSLRGAGGSVWPSERSYRTEAEARAELVFMVKRADGKVLKARIDVQGSVIVPLATLGA